MLNLKKYSFKAEEITVGGDPSVTISISAKARKMNPQTWRHYTTAVVGFAGLYLHAQKKPFEVAYIHEGKLHAVFTGYSTQYPIQYVLIMTCNDILDYVVKPCNPGLSDSVFISQYAKDVRHNIDNAVKENYKHTKVVVEGE